MPGLLARLAMVREPAVVLVVPDGGQAWANPARLELLRRYATRQRVGIALVTTDPATQRLAAEIGLPVYRSVAEAQRRGPWRPPADESMPEDPRAEERARLLRWRRAEAARRARLIAQARRRRPSAWRSTAGLMLLLALLASGVILTAALLLPVAEVTLAPALQPVAVTVDLTALPGVDYPDVDRRLIPARLLEVQIEGNGALPTTGRRDAPDQRATGSVIFINRQSAPLEIPMGTVVRTSTGTNVRFRTTVTGTLPAGIGARVEVPIEAIDPGPAGNVRSGTITQVDGPLAPVLQVINERPTSGGTVRQVSVVTEADKERLRQAVLQQVQQSAYQRLSALLAENEFLPPESVSTVIVAETFDRFVDEPADTLRLRLRVLARGLAVDEAAGRQIALRVMQAQIPAGSRLLRDRVRFQRGPVTARGGQVTYRLTATGEMVGDIDRAAVRAAIAGLPVDQARARLAEQWPLVSPPEIRLQPGWIRRVPWIPFRIRVHIDWTRL